MVRVVVRGIGDHGSAVAHALFGAGHAVVIHSEPLPADCHRGMAFTDAVYDGGASLAGVTAVRVDDVAVLDDVLAAHQHVPVVTATLAELLAGLRPDVLVDVRMRKREQPEPQRGLAPLTIGLGPGYVAGETVDVAVETGFGADFGRVLTEGRTRDLEGEPPPVRGAGRERFLYAPVAGTVCTGRRLGEAVRAGEVVLTIGDTPLHAALDGVLRGLTHDGAPVTRGWRVAEVDPTGAGRLVTGIGQRQARMGDVVVQTLATWVAGGLIHEP